jgi:N-methylhydantoinase B
VLRDVIEGKVSLAASRDDYGVVLKEEAGGPFAVDDKATAALRQKLQRARTGGPPMIDRGTGFDKMIRGEVKPWTRSA